MIVSKPSTEEYRNNYDMIFGKKQSDLLILCKLTMDSIEKGKKLYNYLKSNGIKTANSELLKKLESIRHLGTSLDTAIAELGMDIKLYE